MSILAFPSIGDQNKEVYDWQTKLRELDEASGVEHTACFKADGSGYVRNDVCWNKLYFSSIQELREELVKAKKKFLNLNKI